MHLCIYYWYHDRILYFLSNEQRPQAMHKFITLLSIKPKTRLVFQHEAYKLNFTVK